MESHSFRICGNFDCLQNFHIRKLGEITTFYAVHFTLNKVVFEIFTPFLTIVSFLYPLKTSENLWFSDALRGLEREEWAGVK